jgi:hypothetical protein
MARVTFVGRAMGRGALPKVCMICGDDAKARLRKRFTWHPPWVYLLIFTGLLPYAIGALILSKNQAVDLPMCARHRHYWTIRLGIIFASFAAILLLSFGLIAVAASQDWGGWVCSLVIFFFVAWIVEILVLQLLGLRACEITDNSITLTNISPIFVEEWRAYQRERKSRRYEDDYEDRRPRRPREAIEEMELIDDPEAFRERPPRRRRRDEDDFED